MEKKLNLKDETLDTLQDLIRTNLDSAGCLKEAASSVNDRPLADVFLHVSKKREAHATELQTYVAANREKPENETTLRGDLRKTWLNFRAALSAGSRQVVLNQAEAAEDVIKAEYEKALVNTAGSAMNDVLMRHMREVKTHHDRIRDLRDAA
jgi:uncharacterized protein (TIGR02284 family)